MLSFRKTVIDPFRIDIDSKRTTLAKTKITMGYEKEDELDVGMDEVRN